MWNKSILRFLYLGGIVCCLNFGQSLCPHLVRCLTTTQTPLATILGICLKADCDYTEKNDENLSHLIHKISLMVLLNDCLDNSPPLLKKQGENEVPHFSCSDGAIGIQDRL